MHGDRCSRPIIKPHTRLLVDELGNIKLISMQPIVHYSVDHMLNDKLNHQPHCRAAPTFSMLHAFLVQRSGSLGMRLLNSLYIFARLSMACYACNLWHVR